MSVHEDTPHTVHRDVILMADASPEGHAIAAALRTQGFAVARSSVERLDESVLEESPRVLIVDIDAPGVLSAIERIRELPEGARAELVCLGNPLRAAEVGATTASGRAFARPVDIHAIIAQIGALADPAPLDEEFLDDSFHETSARRPGESIAPFAEDGTGAFAAGFQSVFPGGPDVSDMGSSIFPPDESPTALLAAHPMQLSPELTELLAAAEQKVMLADAFVSIPPAPPHADEDPDVVLSDDYLSLLEMPMDSDDDAPGTGPELGQTGTVDVTTGPIPLAALSSTQASPSAARSVPDTLPPITHANISSVGGSPPVDTTPPVPRPTIGQATVREPIRVREVVSDKLPISYTDEPHGGHAIPRPSPVGLDNRPTTSSTAVTVVESLVPARVDDQQPTRRIEPPAVVASVKRPLSPIVIDAGLDTQPPTVFPGRIAHPVPRIDVAPLTSHSSPTTQPSMATTGAPSTLNPSTVDPSTSKPASPKVPSSDGPATSVVLTNALPAVPPPPNPYPTNPATVIPPTAKPISPLPRDLLPSTTRPISPPLPVPSRPASSQPVPPSSAPSSPRPTKPTPLLPPPQLRRVTTDSPPSVRLAPPVPPPPAPVVFTGTSEGDLEVSLQNDKPTVLNSGDAPRALARAIASRVTGSLALHNQGAVRRVVLQEGDVVTAGSGLAEESLLTFLAKRGDIERDVATRLAGKLPPGGRHAGAALIAHGYLGQDALWQVLRAHAEWIIGAFLLVDAGTLELESEPPGRLRTEPSVFGGSMGAEVFVEAVRRVIAPDVALQRMGGTAARLDAGSRFSLLAECALRPDEQSLIGGAAGATLGEIVDRAGSDTATLLYALVCLDVLSVLAPVKRVEKSRPAAHDPLDQEAIRMRVRARLALVEEGDYFAVLGVPHGATSYEIRRAFIDLRRSFEPSRLLTAETADLTNDVRTVLEVLDEAYEILKDAHRRERYRRAIEAGPV